MLYALSQPASFALLVVSFVVATTLHGWVQAFAAARAGERQPVLERRLRPDPRRHLDPFGTIAGAVSGTGWSRQTEVSRRRSTAATAAVLLSGTAVNLALGAGCLVAAGSVGGFATSLSLLDLQRGIPHGGTAGGALYLFGLSNLGVGVLSLVPIPPLPLGRLVLAAAPRSHGWQQVEYRLVEQNIGVVVLLVALLIPLGGPQPLLPTVLDDLVRPLLRALLGV